ncbi:DUF998 domain-containing protein [Leifsonia aquatica]|uniref:DUF998 domain-containing protein n=1 Tax=Leifsonia aquatica TaxID=144185 RepID=A0A7W4UWZ4_LEIAQ|nr:hypothetical protein [Leifsonia aquatica]
MLAVLCVVALAAVAVTLGALVVLHLAPSGLSPLRDPVSAYGISRFSLLYRAQTLGTAVSAAALAVALPVAGVGAVTAAVIALIVLAVTRGVISWVPMDAEGAPRTSTGRTHNLLAFGAFAAASVGGFMVGIAFGSTGGLAVAAPLATTFGWIMSVASALTILASLIGALRPIFGLAERLIYVGMLAWLATTAVALMGR